MQKIQSFKAINLKQPIYSCNLDSKCLPKPLTRTKQNSEPRNMHQPTQKKIHKLAAIFGKFQIKLKCTLNILRQ